MRRRLLSSLGIKATLISQLDTQAGDVVFYDLDNDAKVYYRLNDGEDVIPKSYAPIGIVVIPASHNVYGDYACGVMSLVGMSYNNPDTGSITPSGLYWGPAQDIESLYNYNRVVNIGTTEISSSAQGLDWFGVLPSDIFTGDACETGFYPNEWPYGTVYSPSPYNADGSRNPVYYQTSSPSDTTNALSDFSGKQNTQQILDLSIGQYNWRTDSTIINSDSTGYYPSACCCWRFHTEGTKQGDWYLPSCGELGYMVPKLGIILNTLSKLRNLSIDVFTDDFINNKVWTSTEYADYSVREIFLSIGHIFDGYKNDASKIAIAFTQMGALERSYGDILISGGTVSDIPAGGGESQVSGYTYSQTYGYGGSTTNGGTITSGADIEVTSVSANNLGTTEKERTKIGDSVLTVTMNGKSATASYEVYQQANVKSVSDTSGGVYSYGNISAGSISNATIGAGGGSATAYAGNGSQSWSRTAITTSYSYTSGATSSAVTTAASSGTNSVAPSASSYTASANSKGTNVSGVTTVGSKYITWSANGKSTGGTMYVYQAANAVVSKTWLNGTPQFNVQTTITNLSGSYTLSGSGDCANGDIHQIDCKYSTTCRFTITFKALAKGTFTSGSTGPVELTSYNQNISSDASIGLTVTGSYPTYNCTLSRLSAGQNFPSKVFSASICFSNTCEGDNMLKIYRKKY